jgi:hypothetical protein
MSTDHIAVMEPPHIFQNDRTSLASELKSWIGHQNSQLGIQYLELVDGKVTVKNNVLERRDVLRAYFPGVGNIFVEPDGSYVFNFQVDKDQRAIMKSYVDIACIQHKKFIQRHKQFFREEPWRQLNGLTPEEAIAKLAQLGWQ